MNVKLQVYLYCDENVKVQVKNGVGTTKFVDAEILVIAPHRARIRTCDYYNPDLTMYVCRFAVQLEDTDNGLVVFLALLWIARLTREEVFVYTKVSMV